MNSGECEQVDFLASVISARVEDLFQDSCYNPCILLVLLSLVHCGLSTARSTPTILSLGRPTGEKGFPHSQLGSMLKSEGMGWFGDD